MSLSGLDQQVYQYMEGTGALQPASNPRTDRERGIDFSLDGRENPRGQPSQADPFGNYMQTMPSPEIQNLPLNPNELPSDVKNQIEALIRGSSPSASIDEGIQELQMQLMSTEDPEEKQMLSRMIENIELSTSAPLADFAKTVQEAGTNEDTVLAHLSPGEVVLPAQMFEDDPKFENLIERKFQSYGIQPETAIAGTGIAALNPATGLEEFGFFKKIGKALKKVIRPIAKVAQFIPGPWQPIAAIADKALTVYDVAKGKQSPLALAGLASPIPTAGKIGSGGGIRGLLGKTKEYILPGADDRGLFKNIGRTFRGGLGGERGDQFNILQEEAGMSPQEIRGLARQGVSVQDQYDAFSQTPEFLNRVTIPNAVNVLDQLSQDPSNAARLEELRKSGMGPAQIVEELQKGTDLGLSNLMPQQQGGSLLQRLGIRQDQPGQSALGRIEDMLKGRPSDPVRQGGGLDSLLGQAGGGRLGGNLLGGGGISGLLAAGVPAYLLGKMAMDEARTRKGVPLTPLTTMDPVGRYNIEAEIARRMGNAQPNPVEFGLMPQGTFPELSGSAGRRPPVVSRYVDDFRNMSQGGTVYPMAYAEGGNVAMEDFQRMNGGISGEGTETSDDIPAMLSDGEFVMTGQAVRGAGTYEIENKGGIISLIPSAQESRERGTQNMYSLMSAFENQAGVA